MSGRSEKAGALAPFQKAETVEVRDFWVSLLAEAGVEFQVTAREVVSSGGEPNEDDYWHVTRHYYIDCEPAAAALIRAAKKANPSLMRRPHSREGRQELFSALREACLAALAGRRPPGAVMAGDQRGGERAE